jgi:hypothetical protein
MCPFCSGERLYHLRDKRIKCDLPLLYSEMSYEKQVRAMNPNLNGLPSPDYFTLLFAVQLMIISLIFHKRKNASLMLLYGIVFILFGFYMSDKGKWVQIFNGTYLHVFNDNYLTHEDLYEHNLVDLLYHEGRWRWQEQQ